MDFEGGLKRGAPLYVQTGMGMQGNAVVKEEWGLMVNTCDHIFTSWVLFDHLTPSRAIDSFVKEQVVFTGEFQGHTPPYSVDMLRLSGQQLKLPMCLSTTLIVTFQIEHM